MAFKPGQSGNPGGRPKGSKNRADQELKQWLQMLVDGQRTQFEKDLKKVNPAQRLAILERLMSFLIPKQQSLSTEDRLRIEYDQILSIIKQTPEDGLEMLERKITEFLTLKREYENENN